MQQWDENKSGGLGKSSKNVWESTADEESRERFELLSKCSGSGDGEGSRWVSIWSCAVWAADTREEGGATCVGAGPRPDGRSSPAVVSDVETVLGGSPPEKMGETQVGKEGAGGS